MRVYLAANASLLADAVRDRALPARLPAHAVTRALRSEHLAAASAGGSAAGAAGPDAGAGGPDTDTDEELELEALLDAARSSLHLLADGREVPRRVVLAVDVPDDDVEERQAGSDAASAVRLHSTSERPPLAAVVSVHVDEPEAAVDVAAAARALAGEPPSGADGEGEAAVERAEERDLLWYDATELEQLVTGLTAG